MKSLSEDLRKMDKILSKYEKQLDIKTKNDAKLSKIHLVHYRGLEPFQLPKLDWVNWEDVQACWPTVNYDLFPRWKPLDIPVMFLTGIIASLVSSDIKDQFAEKHDKWSSETFLDAEGNFNWGHSGQINDYFDGRAGGFLHRFKYGHDMLNPFEIDWANYFPSGNENIGLFTKVLGWIAHLAQDIFSSEGLPLPGSSYFRDMALNSTEFINYKTGLYNQLLTLKARDLSAAAIVTGGMTAYVFASDFHSQNKFYNYRYLSLTIGSLMVCIITGLLTSNPSFNHFALMAIVPYVVTLWKLDRELSTNIENRQKALLTRLDLLTQRRDVIDAQSEIVCKSLKELNQIHDTIRRISSNLLCFDQTFQDDCRAVFSKDDKSIRYFEQILGLKEA